MVIPPEIAEEIPEKPLRARLLPGKEHAIQISDCKERDGGLARGVTITNII
ncbi:MAG: hypothetical protein ACLQT6_02590 [Desulfomonilaceae bacterium]